MGLGIVSSVWSGILGAGLGAFCRLPLSVDEYYLSGGESESRYEPGQANYI
jgi:hypothetical protein